MRWYLVGSVLLCVLGVLAAEDARRAEEDDRVLDVLRLESPQRLELLREDSDGPRFLAVEKLLVVEGQLRFEHDRNVSSAR